MPLKRSCTTSSKTKLGPGCISNAEAQMGQQFPIMTMESWQGKFSAHRGACCRQIRSRGSGWSLPQAQPSGSLQSDEPLVTTPLNMDFPSSLLSSELISGPPYILSPIWTSRTLGDSPSMSTRKRSSSNTTKSLGQGTISESGTAGGRGSVSGRFSTGSGSSCDDWRSAQWPGLYQCTRSWAVNWASPTQSPSVSKLSKLRAAPSSSTSSPVFGNTSAPSCTSDPR